MEHLSQHTMTGLQGQLAVTVASSTFLVTFFVLPSLSTVWSRRRHAGAIAVWSLRWLAVIAVVIAVDMIVTALRMIEHLGVALWGERASLAWSLVVALLGDPKLFLKLVNLRV